MILLPFGFKYEKHQTASDSDDNGGDIIEIKINCTKSLYGVWDPKGRISTDISK